jgi:hypothetical protein
MMNEAHSGLKRCVRTRLLGARLLPVAHRAGVRRLAMEALIPGFAAEANEARQVPAVAGGYLAQPEMRELITVALDLGWQLVPYEADFNHKPAGLRHLSVEETNWREDQQARNLCSALEKIPADEGVLVWCGNHHLAKRVAGQWVPMRVRFGELSSEDAFVIDQTPTVKFGSSTPAGMDWVDAYASEIEGLGGTAGFLSEDAPDGWPSPELADAFIVAQSNDLE